MKLAAFACAAFLAFGTAVAHAACTGHCEDGYTWSSESGSCVPKTVSS